MNIQGDAVLLTGEQRIARRQRKEGARHGKQQGLLAGNSFYNPNRNIPSNESCRAVVIVCRPGRADRGERKGALTKFPCRREVGGEGA